MSVEWKCTACGQAQPDVYCNGKAVCYPCAVKLFKPICFFQQYDQCMVTSSWRECKKALRGKHCKDWASPDAEPDGRFWFNKYRELSGIVDERIGDTKQERYAHFWERVKAHRHALASYVATEGIKHE